MAQLTIINYSDHSVNISLSGATYYTVSVEAGTIKLSVQAGEYRVVQFCLQKRIWTLISQINADFSSFICVHQ